MAYAIILNTITILGATATALFTSKVDKCHPAWTDNRLRPSFPQTRPLCSRWVPTAKASTWLCPAGYPLVNWMELKACSTVVYVGDLGVRSLEPLPSALG